MIYTISIDWLSLYCRFMPTVEDASESVPVEWQPKETEGGDAFGKYPWRYKKADYGTRQFSSLHFVSMPNAEGGWDEFAEVQSAPYSGILSKNSIIVRFVNRALYMPDFWELADRFLSDNSFIPQGITRIDICADFNDFACMSPLALIEGFAAKKYRHIGRGVGALYFNHGVVKKEYGVLYNGLSFGTHSSDARVYLYNKSFELLTQGDKPWIKDRWKHVGLDILSVWRLEVSLKSKACTFKDKASGNTITFDKEGAADDDILGKIYHTFIKKLFSFVPNRKGITNITHEWQKNGLKLFDAAPSYDRGCIRNITPGNRMEKILIKALYQMGDQFRGGEIVDAQLRAQEFAFEIANACDLNLWLSNKIEEWEKPIHK